MIKITGLDRLTRELGEAQQAFAELDGRLGSVEFDPGDAESIEEAIRNMETMIDVRIGRLADSRLVAPLIVQTKAAYRPSILDAAAAARLEKGQG